MSNVTKSETQTVPKKKSLAGKPASEAAPGGLRAQGLRTRNTIVEVAKAVLLDGGGLEFSLREVASRAGISISNLQYYFPTRLALLRAIIEPVIGNYLQELNAAFDRKIPPHATLISLLEEAFQDTKNPESTALWWHFVSFAAIDEECSRLMDEWYETLTREMAKCIKAVYPDYTNADCLHRATLLIAMIDGINYQQGAGRRKRSYTRGLGKKFLAAADIILSASLGGDE